MFCGHMDKDKNSSTSLLHERTAKMGEYNIGNLNSVWKRLFIGMILGPICGGICLIGATGRLGGWAGHEAMLMGLFFNRVVMGLIVALCGWWTIFSEEFLKEKHSSSKWLLWVIVGVRGMFLGLFVSFEFFLTTSFADTPTFVIGLAYGLIMDLVATKFGGEVS